jgi:hypothetical protein
MPSVVKSREDDSAEALRGLAGSVGGPQPEPSASNLLINASPCTRKIPSTGLRIAGQWRRNRRGRRWPPPAAPSTTIVS